MLNGQGDPDGDNHGHVELEELVFMPDRHSDRDSQGTNDNERTEHPTKGQQEAPSTDDDHRDVDQIDGLIECDDRQQDIGRNHESYKSQRGIGQLGWQLSKDNQHKQRQADYQGNGIVDEDLWSTPPEIVEDIKQDRERHAAERPTGATQHLVVG